ncbi:hypothetical protein H5410_006114 [Solanum commersonii]|uniref:Uncharacterized protein n=1 Tax=Solanum commersonii TaxID=4109 RepID=A0A9J6A8Z8_SOLCO|nr:hypothetical protein H5410_006114 [Solanum commersonii]
MPMLFEGKQKIDVMIVNVSNLLFVDLLAQAKALNIISLIVCDELMNSLQRRFWAMEPIFTLKSHLTRKLEKVRERSGKHKDQMKVDDVGNNKIVRENKESEEKSMS